MRGGQEVSRQISALEQVDKGAEAQPEVGVIRPGGLDVEHPAQAGNAVMIAIDGIGADEAPVFGHEQEQETVNQPEELVVELGGRELLGFEFLAEFFVILVREKAV